MPAPFHSRTRAQVRQGIGYLMFGREGFQTGTVLASPAPTSTTFALEVAKRFPDDSFNGRGAYVVSGTGVGQMRPITDHVRSTGVLTVPVAFTTTLDATSVVEIWPDNISPDEVNAAIERAIEEAADTVAVYAEAITGLAADEKSLVLPATWTHVVDFTYQDSSGVWRVFRPMDWLDHLGGYGFTLTAQTIYFSETLPDGTATYKARGYRLPALPTADSDVLEVRPDWVQYTTAMHLEAARAASQSLDPEQHAARAANWAKLRKPLEMDWHPFARRIRG